MNANRASGKVIEKMNGTLRHSTKSYYVVIKGRKPGVYTDWLLAKEQIYKFPGSVYRKFQSISEGRAWAKTYIMLKSGIGNSKEVPSKTHNKKKSKKKRKYNTLQPIGEIKVYTDGACINPGRGGYSTVIIYPGGDHQEFFGGYVKTTNNRMEIMGCICAMRKLQGEERTITLFSDSKYVVYGMTKGWAKRWKSKGWIKSDGEPTFNSDLWEEMLSLSRELRISFQWVKGHNGDTMNERCDFLAKKALNGHLLVDENYVAFKVQPIA